MKTFEHVDGEQNLANRTFEDWPVWKYTIAYPSTVLMGASGTPELGRYMAVGSAWAQVVSHFLPDAASILDIGCGCGKTARFLAADPRVAHYFGFDPISDSIAWCNRYVRPFARGQFRFEYVDLHSDEYNPGGTLRAENYRFPLESASIDVVIAASLFTHLLESAAVNYLAEISRVLKPGGKALLSLHTQPPDGSNYSGSEGRVDVQQEYFLSMARRAGLDLHEDLGSFCGQETLVLSSTS